ncbi:HlyC/CorC family transporter [Thiofilum flexile]|uniref:HlyC/CorC family transporter n=1 Tax=Thiofilum flexile TaxID=125627 RepID=UPI000369A122|nr:HlyC/CorC family transporter [Thiofilum flexile]
MSIDSIPISILVIALVGLFSLSAFFSGSETALMTLNRYRLRHLADQNHKGALLAQKLLDDPERLIGMILLGNNFINIIITQLATLLGLRLFGDAGLALATGILTLLLLIFGEVMPKTVGALHPERIAFPAAYIYSAMLKVLWPFVWIVNSLVSALLKLFGLSSDSSNRIALSREELRSVVTAAGTTIPKNHVDMLVSVLDLESTTIEDIMIPRSQIYAIDLESDWSDIEDQLSRSNFTRILVYRDSLDQVEGFVHVRKIFPLLRDGYLTRERLESIIRPAYFVPEGVSLTQQLINFREEARRIAVVVDEYGEVQGLITMEDILEEIVGEFSTVPPSLSREILHREDGSASVDGSLHLREINRLLEINLPTDGAKTLNGLITEHLQEIPVPSMTVLINDYPIEIRKTRNNAVKTAIIYPRLIRDSEQDNPNG